MQYFDLPFSADMYQIFRISTLSVFLSPLCEGQFLEINPKKCNFFCNLSYINRRMLIAKKGTLIKFIASLMRYYGKLNK